MSAIALVGPEDTNVIYHTEDPIEFLYPRLKRQYEDSGNQVTILDASRYGNGTRADLSIRKFTTPNRMLEVKVSHFDMVIVTNFEKASKQTRDALIELVTDRTIDGNYVRGITAVVFVVSSLKAPNVVALRQRAGHTS